MHILILNWKDIKNPDVGGAEIILYEYAKRLIKDGHRVSWFARSYQNCLKTEVIDGISIIRQGGKLSVYFYAYLYYRSLGIKPDKVLDCINTICFMTPFYIPKEKRIMYVNQLAKEVFFYELPFPLSYIAYGLERLEYIPYRDTKTVCYSQSTKDDLVTFGIPENNISVFPLGVDHERYIPGIKSKNPLFIFVARLVYMKRPILCIEAMKKVIREYPKAVFAIIGNGPLENKIENKINHLNLNNNVILVNKNNLFFMNNPLDLKVQYMQKAWALILPSVKEGWGMVVTEAASCGTPSIVTNVTGLRDSVIQGKTGIIINAKPTDSELATTILKYIGNINNRKIMSEQAQIFSRSFSWNKSYQKFCTLILDT
jgi:glycosyltransferase involved in cell wall biosynthesis